MRWAGHVAQAKKMYRILVTEPGRRSLLGRFRLGWEYNIKIYVTELGWEGMDRIHLAEDRFK
jgi:hypothetical protein